MNGFDIQKIEDLATKLNIEEGLIEKDWYVVRAIEIIASLDHNDAKPIFSGGTSLSKAWGIIKRFSEDIDFKVMMPKFAGNAENRNRRREFREQTLSALTANRFELVGKVMSRNESQFFAANLAYPNYFDVGSGLRPYLRVEMTFLDPALKPIDRPVRSLLAEAQQKPPEVSGILCSNPVEIAAEKLSALAWRVCTRQRGSVDDDPTIIRHLHDLSALENHIKTDHQFIELVKKVLIADTGRGGNAVPPNPSERLSKMIDLLKGDNLWKADYDKFVTLAGFAQPDKKIAFNEALASTQRLVEIVSINNKIEHGVPASEIKNQPFSAIPFEKKDFRDELTEQLIKQLEQGTAPWQKPWNADNHVGRPHNPVSGTVYAGSNNLVLTIKAIENGYTDPRWVTFNQASSKGWSVKRGEHATKIEHWTFDKEIAVKDSYGKPVYGNDGKPLKERIPLDRPYVTYYNLFNAAQIKGIPPLEIKKQEWDPIEKAEKILETSKAKIIHDQPDKAFYRPSDDNIHLPQKAAFKDQIGYYSTALHELAHWTGHPNRLNRDLSGGFGSEKYAKEELRAEIASYFMAAETQIPHNLKDHASYVNSWIEILKKDKHEIFRAASDAGKISDYLTRGIDLKLQQEKTLEDKNLAQKNKEIGKVIKQGEFLESRTQELERFKRDINLSEFVASKGYSLDPRASYRNVAVMRNGDEKINISKDKKDGHWVYHSWKTGEGGSIIDFVQKTTGLSLGDVRKELRPWIGESKPVVSPQLFQKEVEPVAKDKTMTLEYLKELKEVEKHGYLESRGIDSSVLANDRFKGRVFADSKGNAVFPHLDKEGVSGLELRNVNFKGFVKGGDKSLWLSKFMKDDNRLVITEAVIDAMSYHKIKGDDNTRYIAFGGNMSDKQKELVGIVIAGMSKGAEVVIATDKDKAGDLFAEQIKEIAQNKEIKLKRDTPEIGKDWNEQLKHDLEPKKEMEISRGMRMR